jgi:hypothetical protein
MNEELRHRAAVGIALASLVTGSAAQARPAGWPSTADAEVARDGAVLQVTRSMSLDLPGSAAAAFPLLGPVGERAWSPRWDPQFIVPADPGQSPAGAVFTVGQDSLPSVWVMTDFDPDKRIVRYVVIRPGRVVIQLWIEVTPVSATSSKAEVTYRYTAIGPDGRQALDRFKGTFPSFKPHWEAAIGAALIQGAGAGPAHHRS